MSGRSEDVKSLNQPINSMPYGGLLTSFITFSLGHEEVIFEPISYGLSIDDIVKNPQNRHVGVK